MNKLFFIKNQQSSGRSLRYVPIKGKYLKKKKKLKSVFYCYVHKLTYENTTFTHYLGD